MKSRKYMEDKHIGENCNNTDTVPLSSIFKAASFWRVLFKYVTSKTLSVLSLELEGHIKWSKIILNQNRAYLKYPFLDKDIY